MMIKELLSKQKFKHFLYVHALFLLGLAVFDVSVWSLVVGLVVFLTVVNPLLAVITHHHFNHGYANFRNSLAELFGLLFLTTFTYWKFSDLKSYHIYHHTKWLTDLDPTANEIRQGKLRYYVGLTEPSMIPKVAVKESDLFELVSKYFYQVKFLIYAVIVLLFGIQGLFHVVIVQQFYYFVCAKLHDMTFHSSDTARDLPWLMPVFSNDAWHIDHHKDFATVSPWHCRTLNLQYWYSLVLFK